VSAGKAAVIVLARQLPEIFTGALAQLGELRVAGTGHDDSVFDGASVYLATGVDPVPAALMERFPPGLGLIANIATGTDNIDLEAAAARGLYVSNTPVVAEDTADLAMGLILSTCRLLSFCERALRAGDWGAGFGRMGARVHGKTLGIVGMGAIGRALARRAAAFDMSILYHAPNRKPEAEESLGVRYRPMLKELLEESDIVSLNCPLTPDSHHLMNGETLNQMRRGACLINTGRGPLVDEKALVQALESGHLGGAGLDVYEFEPQVAPQLLAFDNVTLLPHIGGATAECRQDMALRALANIRQYLAGGKPIDICVPRPITGDDVPQS